MEREVDVMRRRRETVTQICETSHARRTVSRSIQNVILAFLGARIGFLVHRSELAKENPHSLGSLAFCLLERTAAWGKVLGALLIPKDFSGSEFGHGEGIEPAEVDKSLCPRISLYAAYALSTELLLPLVLVI